MHSCVHVLFICNLKTAQQVEIFFLKVFGQYVHVNLVFSLVRCFYILPSEPVKRDKVQGKVNCDV